MIVLYSILAGFAVGTVAGLTGIGGGAFLVPIFVYWFKMDMYKAVGTSLAVIAPICLIGAISHHTKGNVDLSSVLFIGLGAAAGMLLSGQVIEYIPAAILRKAFAVLIFVIAIKMFMK